MKAKEAAGWELLRPKMRKQILIFFYFFICHAVFANPVSIPMFKYLKKGNTRIGVKQFYIIDDNFGESDKRWQIDTHGFLTYGVSPKIEIDMLAPYTTSSQTHISGLGDVEGNLRWWFYSSNREDFYPESNLDLFLGLGGKLKTGEIKKGMGNRETDIILSFSGKYELDKNRYNFYFNTSGYKPVEGEYIYKNIFKYDLGIETIFKKNISIVLEGNGEQTTVYKKFYVTPAAQFKSKKNWEFNLGCSIAVSDKGGFTNTKTSLGVFKTF